MKFIKKLFLKIKKLKLRIQKRIKNLSKKIYFELFIREIEDLNQKHEFENFITKILESQKQDFKIIRRSLRQNNPIYQTPSRPSLLLEYIPTKERIALECKFRTSLKRSRTFPDKVLKWATSQQLKDYSKFCEKFHIPLYIAIGLGGSPNDPKKSFCVPFEVAKSPELPPSILEIYRREPKDKSFHWKNGNLK